MKIRKKRLVYIFVLLNTAIVAYLIDPLVALTGFSLFLILLGLLALYRRLTAHWGFRALDAYRKTCAIPTMTETAQQLAANQDAFSVVVLGDTRNKRVITEAVYQQAAKEKPVAVFHTGDIVRHGTAKEFIEHHLSLIPIFDPAPMFCAPGNHERGARRDFAAFKRIYGETRFALELGPCQFTGFNNSRKGRVSSDDMSFLEKTLALSQAKYRFVFFHIPPAFFEGRIVKDKKRRGFTRSADQLHGLLQRYQVTEVFMAHIHGYATEVIDGIRYTLTAGGGATLDPRLAPEGRVHHYITVHINGKSASREVVRLNGDTWQRDERMDY